MSEPVSPAAARFARFLCTPRLPLWLGLIGVLLCAPAVFIGFHLDDLAHRHMFSDRPLGKELYAAYESPFGIANGEPASMRWQITEGFAPWYTVPNLLISMWRPIAEWTHRLDMALWFDSAVAMHLHSLLWFLALLYAVTVLYRLAHGPTTVAGMAALLYTIDHTHGFAVGWIANRNVLIAAFFAVCALALFVRAEGRWGWLCGSALALGLSLLSGEGALAITGYMASYALCVSRGPFFRRLGSLLPALVVVVAWRLVYQAIGRGAHGSGLYIDPLREPLPFLLAVVERAPVLLLGALGLPPAETFLFVGAGGRAWLWGLACALSLMFVLILWPLLRADRKARAWALGAVLALLPACTTHPHNRLLFFVGIGLMALLSQVFHGYVEPAQAGWLPTAPGYRRLTTPFAASLVGFRLLVSPALLPLMACSVAFTAPIDRGLSAMLERADLPGKQLVVLHAQDYYQVKLLPSAYALAGLTPPRRIRALSFGSGPVIARRVGKRSLELEWPEGLLSSPADELYRAAHLPLGEGAEVVIPGMKVQVVQQRPDGRVGRARFEFDTDLDASEMRWVRFDERQWRDVTWSDVGDALRTESKEALVGL